MKREVPSTESPVPRVARRELWCIGRRGAAPVDSIRVLTTEAIAQSGCQAHTVRTRASLAAVLGVGLFESAAQSGW